MKKLNKENKRLIKIKNNIENIDIAHQYKRVIIKTSFILINGRKYLSDRCWGKNQLIFRCS